MATKTIKKKNITKKPVVKKTSAKTTLKKTNVHRAQTVATSTPMQQMPECRCGCGCGCGCGHRFIKFCIKLIVLCMAFFLGVIVSPHFVKKSGHHMMRDIAFNDNGCVVLETVKCPKLLETLATADDDANGCISHEELKNAVHEMHVAKHTNTQE